jgi:NADPH:quinone reductase-like Zn-dependent oxidoreductase
MVIPAEALELRSLVRGEGLLELSLARVSLPVPKGDEILVRVEAAPINPSDQGLLFSAADLDTMKASGTPDRPVLTAMIPEQRMRAVAARVEQSLAVGNEGAGVVVAAGPDAASLMGKTVSMFGGSMYAQYRLIHKADVIVLPDGVTAVEGAASFVNPLTALGMLETMRRHGHTALVHTAAASNLGQMLNRVCVADGIALVNIVRTPEQVALLRDQGAAHVCDISSENFMEELVDALASTGATIAFDAIGGGKLASRILSGMEAVAGRSLTAFSPYGSDVMKQVFIYGGLDLSPTQLARGFGMAWNIGGWLLFPFLATLGPADRQRLHDRVVAELKTTFASRYSHEISLAEALAPATIKDYSRRSTSGKYVIRPAL